MRQKRELQVQQPQLHFPPHLCFYILSYFSLPLVPHPQLFLLSTCSLSTAYHPTHTPLCQLVSQLPHSVTLHLSTKMFSNDSAWFSPCPTLSSITHALPITCCSTSVTNYFVTLALSPWLLPALPCLLPISLILFYPFPVFGLPSSGSAVLLSNLLFSSIGLYCSQVVFPFLLPPAAWMPAEGAVCTVPRVSLLSASASYRRYTDAPRISRDGRALIPSDVISCSKFS